MNRGKWALLTLMVVLGGAACSVVLGIDGEYEDCICGDGVVCSIEQCDDGNTSEADRCSSTCVVQEVVEISAGHKHTCARLNNGAVKCWGTNANNILGMGVSSDVDAGIADAGVDNAWGDEPNEMGSHLPAMNLGEGRTAVKIAAGFEHTCAILDDGNVKCWGTSMWNELGVQRPDGTVDLGLEKGIRKSAVAIVAGLNTTCVITNDGGVLCWGRNDSGQLGGDSTDPNPVNTIQAVELGKEKAMALAGGYSHTCALLESKKVKCWGKNDYGKLGIGDTAAHLTPTGPVDFNGKGAVAIATGLNHTCALLEDNSLWCWGAGTYGALGTGTLMDVPYPLPQGPIDLGPGYVANGIAAGQNHTCAILREGFVKCWGYNAAGEVGIEGGKIPSPSPVINLGSDKTAVAITAGQLHTCVILKEGAVACWGSNSSGQLGLEGADPGGKGDSHERVHLFSDVW